MIGQEYKSEMSRYADELSGHEIVKLTNDYQNYHLYFTENSFTLGDEEIVFLSSRPSQERNCFNYFKMDLKTGKMVQLTDEKDGVDNDGHTKTPDSKLLLYICNKRTTLKMVDTETGKNTILYQEEDPHYTLEQPSFSSDHRYVGFVRNENTGFFSGDNYVGFKEKMYASKIGQIVLVPMDQPGKSIIVWTDTHQLGHLQFSPIVPTLLSFCHEGPWNYVQQRIWLLDIVSRVPVPCFRQEEDDSVGHEFWTRNNLVFFDNRRAGHDGTITVSRTQAVTNEASANVKKDQIPYVGFANAKGEVVRTLALPFYCNHYHANTDNTLLVGDDVDNLDLIDIRTDTAEIKTLCHHGTSWNGQITHCHPTWSWNSKKILYESDAGKKCNLYLIEV
ncbi:oligogalacturonate lyase family protein [uncultured Sphaerochaeta sp.]|uniref:oligogalacturonate lyase family protein n=1 Tax=uncultured Sphaerochaeta sp. TaxID=886478 RepID=UPI002A0A60B8|nr:oligogalacturonate lyase family protein [uncultured Sphaerochaeta sp.]